ncbi:MAG: NAD(P)-dependent oxidoreductase [Desulfosarcinaceae bacterium]|nr:NAD(P)-dependent oxidoreductase [Desulfosarcinaceae bacterium]
MRLLVTGMSGFLGRSLAHYLIQTSALAAGEVVATCHQRRLPIDGVSPISVDLADQPALLQNLDEVRPRAVIHMAAVSQPNQCETDATGSAAVNVAASTTIARWCARHAKPLVFTSTDLVFDGKQPPYRESAQPNPLNAYARQKVSAEAAIQTYCPNAVICRLPLLFGFGGSEATGFAHEMVIAIAAKRPIRLFTDEFRTPLSTVCAAKALVAALRWPGDIYHLGGTERISRYAFGQRIAAVLGVGDAHLQPITQADLSMAARRPRDVSLNNRKARAFGFAPQDLDAAIREMLFAFGFADADSR